MKNSQTKIQSDKVWTTIRSLLQKQSKQMCLCKHLYDPSWYKNIEHT